MILMLIQAEFTPIRERAIRLIRTILATTYIEDKVLNSYHQIDTS